jgi:hypothetical protein
MYKLLKLPLKVNKSNGQCNTYISKKNFPKVFKGNVPKSLRVRIEEIEW